MSPNLFCSFCRRPQSAVVALAISPIRIAGLPVAICLDCASFAIVGMHTGFPETDASDSSSKKYDA